VAAANGWAGTSSAQYLIFRADRREVTHWMRGAAAPARPAGRLALDPPGIAIDLPALYERAEAA
jgi:hypothetical protein